MKKILRKHTSIFPTLTLFFPVIFFLFTTTAFSQSEPAFRAGYLVNTISNSSISDAQGHILATVPVGSRGTVIHDPDEGNTEQVYVHFFNPDVTGWVNTAMVQTLAKTGTEIAVYARIVYVRPDLSQRSVDLQNLTREQISAFEEARAELEGKKIIILNGSVVLLDQDVDINLSNTNGVISIQVTRTAEAAIQNQQNAVVVADLNNLHDPAEICSTDDHWYNYIYCDLERRAWDHPGALFGEDAALIDTIRAYLQNRFAGVGGFDQNFILSALNNTISIIPKPNNRLGGLDGQVAMTFSNERLRYDTSAMAEAILSQQDQLADEDPDSFFVASDRVLDAMAMADLDRVVVAPQMNALADSCSVPPEPTCYQSQTGSVIPCNQQIDWVDGFKDFIAFTSIVFYWEIKKLEQLGYTVQRIKDTDYPALNGVDFFKAMIRNTHGQVMMLGFHGAFDDESADPAITPFGFGGAIYPIGCVEESEAGPGGVFEQRLRQDPDFMCLFRSGDFRLFWKKGYGCPSARVVGGVVKKYIGWGVLPNTLRINQKAIESGFPCHGQLCPLQNARALYMNPRVLSSAQWARWDLRLFSRYLSGYGPDDKHYTKYPPDFAAHNLNVSNIMDLGGPCEFFFLSCHQALFWSTKEVPNNEGQIVTALIPTTWQSVIQISDAHLFPYVSDFVLNNQADSELRFSDDVVENPILEFVVRGKTPIESGPVRVSDQLFKFLISPDVEILDKTTYHSYYIQGKDRYIPKSMFSVRGVTAKANRIKMIGNPLASYTSGDRLYRQPFFMHNRYFWYYNARAVGGNKNIFKANTPYKLHPFVTGVARNGNHFTISFSKRLKTVDAGSIVKVDIPRCCLPEAGEVFSSPPVLAGTNPDTITFTINGAELYDPTQELIDDKDNYKKVSVTVKGGSNGALSYWNQFQLLGNTESPLKWAADINGNGEIDWQEQNSHKFPQKEGSWQADWLCKILESPNCAEKACGDDGCGGSCGSCEDPVCKATTASTVDVTKNYGNIIFNGVVSGSKSVGSYPASGDCVLDPCVIQPSCDKDGQCIPAKPKDCDDHNSCTTERCDPDTGNCLYDPVYNCVSNCPPYGCDDGDDCTADSCVYGICQHDPQYCPPSVPPGTACLENEECHDNNSCTSDLCSYGACAYPAVPGCGSCTDDSPCDDQNSCTTDKCADGYCQHQPIPDCVPPPVHCDEDEDCDDDKVCTSDSCVDNACQYAPIPDCVEPPNPPPGCTPGQACNDNNLCTENDVCDINGVCKGTLKDCNDNDACTNDSCNPATGNCQHPPRNCDDSNPCTLNMCDSSVGCFYPEKCEEDGDLCTTNCNSSGDCDYQPKNCSDHNSCTDDTCSEGVCSNTNNTASCNDGNPCTNSDSCFGGSCGGMPIICPGQCEICDRDPADPANAYMCFYNGNGSSCDDGDQCTVNDQCGQSGCAGTTKDCNDNDVCTNDSCDPSTGGCRHDPKCPAGETCDSNGNCVVQCNECALGTPGCFGGCHDRTDGDLCLINTCTNGICAVAVNTGGSCNDADLCTTGDVCLSNGTCFGTPKNCADTDICTNDSCDASTGNCRHDPCPAGTHCEATGCVPDITYPPLTCNECVQGAVGCINGCHDRSDGDPCITNTCTYGICGTAPTQCPAGQHCEPGVGCVSNPPTAGCQTDADCNDNNPCTDDACVNHVCSRTNNTNPCDDGRYCTSEDACLNGICQGVLYDCRDSCQVCVEDSDPSNDHHFHCESVSDGRACDDRDLCTTGDMCTAQGCTGTPCPYGQRCEAGVGCVPDRSTGTWTKTGTKKISSPVRLKK